MYEDGRIDFLMADGRLYQGGAFMVENYGADK